MHVPRRTPSVLRRTPPPTGGAEGRPRRSLLLRALAPAAAAVLVACGAGLLAVSVTESAPRPPVEFGTNIWPGDELLFLAADRGFFPPGKVRLVQYTSATQVETAFRNGTIDVAAFTLDELLRLIAFGDDPKIVLVMDVSNGADAILARPGIDSVRDLRGRTVGVETTALGRYELERALERAGLTIHDITILPLTVDQHVAAYDAGRIDAAVTFEPARSQIMGRGAHSIFSSADIPGEIVDVLVVRPSLLRERPELVEQLRDGWLVAVELLKRSPLEAATAMAPREHVTAQAFLRSLDGILIGDRALNERLVGGAAPTLPAAIEQLRQSMLHAGIPAPAEPVRDVLAWSDGP